MIVLFYFNLSLIILMRFLSRLRSLRQEEQITINAAKLRAKQQQQLSFLQTHTKNVEPSFLSSKIEQLVKINNEKVFNTFSTRCLNPQIRSLNALADVNIERVFQKKAQNKVPFTVKDHLKVQGMIETCGFADNLKPSTVSSEIVEILQRQNCIAFAHTNVPQGLLGIQSNNSVFGLCKNPHNPNFISGGSSGGQAVLVASQATTFGVGSDSGGSARIPAAFCGVYGFKPTGSKRLSVKGRVGPSGVQGVKLGDVDPSFGFITRHFDDIVWLCSKTMGRKIEREVTQLYGGVWDESRFQAAKRKKLKVGYLYENEEMKTAPGIKNSITQTLQLLKSQGHDVAQFKFPRLHHFRNFFFEFVYQTGFLKALAQRTKGHVPSPQAQDFYCIGSEGLPGIPEQLQQQEILKDIYKIYTREQSTWQFFRIHREVADLKTEFLKQWKTQELDILITPVMPFTAPLPGTSDLLVYQLTYCSFQNVLELPAGSIPTRLVNQSQTHYEPSNAYERRVADSIKQSKGLPIGIQVTGSHLQDEECLGAMWQIQKLVGNYIQPPFLSGKN